MAYEPTPDEKQMGMLSHLLAIFTGWLGPLILFLTQKDKGPFVKLHSKQAMVWGITVIVAYIALIIVGFILVFIPYLGAVLGCLLYLGLIAAHLTFTITGTVKVNKGEKFLYPVVAELFCKDEIAAVYGDGAVAVPGVPPVAPPPSAGVPPVPPPSPSEPPQRPQQ